MIEGAGSVETEDGVRPVKAGDLIFIPNEEKHRFRALEDAVIFEFQGPYRYKTIILDGGGQGLAWQQVDGTIRTHIK